MGGRSAKRTISSLLEAGDRNGCLKEIRSLSPVRAVNAIIPLLASSDPAVKWGAVSLMGGATARLAETDLESARIVMRRLMWSLFEESGAIGWGAPEAMGEIMARHDGLAEEYAKILVSYTREDGNFLEYEPLQRGVLWGIGRLAQTRPTYLLAFHAPEFVQPYLDSPDPAVKGLAAWVCGLLNVHQAEERLERLHNDAGELSFYLDDQVVTRRVGDLAKEASQNLKQQ